MSASLVGSEMCIRDRLWAARKGEVIKKGAQNNSSDALTVPRNTHARNAVSYTHLTLPTICSV
eukprot:7673538-Alexandrium_andersonii.AAC.1